MGPIHCVNVDRNPALTMQSVNKTSVRVIMTCTFYRNLNVHIFIAKLQNLNIFYRSQCTNIQVIKDMYLTRTDSAPSGVTSVAGANA